jgi:hypothetical protein
METFLTIMAGAVPSIITAIVAIHLSQKVQAVHLDVNSRLDQLLKAARAASFAEGKAEGKSEGTTSTKEE